MGQAKGCGKAAKYSLCLSNTIFVLVAIGLIGLGAWALTKDGHFPDHLEQTLRIPGRDLAIGAISLGVFVMLVSLFGACGALLESKCLLVVYSMVVFVLVAGQLTVGVLSYTSKGAFDVSIANELAKLPVHEQCDVEQFFQCRGFGKDGKDVPQCPDYTPPTDAMACTPAIQAWVHDNLHTVGIAAISAGSVQILCFILAVGLACALPSKAEEYRRLVDDARRENRKYARV